MSTLSNSAVISSYTFPVGPSTPGSATSNTAVVNIEVTAATVNFTKTNAPEYVQPDSTITLTFKVTNLNTESLKTATIQDPIFTTLGIAIDSITGGTIDKDILTFDLSQGPLITNASKEVIVTLKISPTALPDASLYDTVANGSFIIQTNPETTIKKTSKGHLEVNAANVTLTKTVSPNSTSVTAGNLLTYTVIFTNSGNVEASIGIGHFTDTWVAGSLTNVKSLNPKFSVVGNNISNTENLSIPANSSATLIYTGIAASV